MRLGTKGGELYNIEGRLDNVQYLWNGRKYGWPLSAPTLFPIICKVKDNQYLLDGKKYKMNQHGFASLLKHKVILKTKNEIAFELKYTEDTLKNYPFKFSLISRYVLKDNIIEVNFKIVNLDNKPIIFTIGSHPSFTCPLYKKDNLEDYYLEFNEVEDEGTILEITKDDYLTGDKKVYLHKTNLIPLTTDTFKGGTLIFDNLKSNMISLKSKKHKKSISVEFEEFTYLSLWATENTRPFVCIEPWLGHADYNEFSGEFKDKEGNIVLGVGKTFSCKYRIIINQ